MKNVKIQGFILAFIAGLFWGFSGPLAQYLFDYKGVVSDWLVPCRLLVSGLILLGFVAIKKLPMMSVWKQKKDGIRLILFAIIGMMGVQYTFFLTVQETNAGTATIFQYLNVAMLIVFFAVAYKAKPHGKDIVALLCSMVGIFLVVTHGNINTIAISPFGIVIGLLTAFVTCFYGVLPVPLLKKFDAKIVSGWAMLIGGIVLSFVTRPWTIDVNFDKGLIFALIAVIFIGTVIPFCFYLSALEKIGSVYAGMLAGVEPVTATVVAALFLNTRFELIDVVGFALVLSTIFILNIGTQREEKSDDH